MNDEREFAIGEAKVAHIPAQQGDSRIRSEMGTLPRKPIGVARKDGGFCAKFQGPVCVAEAFNQPATEEAGATCKEKALPTQVFPQARRALQYMSDILRANPTRSHRRSSVYLWST
jgi:hypothetical protein